MKPYTKPQFLSKDEIRAEIVNACSSTFPCPKSSNGNSCDTDPTQGYSYDERCNGCPNKSFQCDTYWICNNAK